jgi:hypothetical protein
VHWRGVVRGMVAKARLVVASSGIRWSSFGLTSSGGSAIPTGFALLFRRYPALTRWAILCRRSAALLSPKLLLSHNHRLNQFSHKSVFA